MKIAYFDCFSGISGDMTVGAFLDAGLKLGLLKKRLGLLSIKGYAIEAIRESRNGIIGTKFNVKIAQKKHRTGTTYKYIKGLINNSRLDKAVKKLSLSIFENLASAEARIHNKDKNDIHFHEAGALDSIIDIVSTAIAVLEFGIEECYCLNLKLGKGSVVSGHGDLPLPAPAALEMLKGKKISFSDVEHELITPTGAAILTTLVKDFDVTPEIDIEAIGYGAGTFQTKGNPNLLRIFLGDSSKDVLAQDEVIVIETNIDDMNPAYYEYLISSLFHKGALDVYLTPVYMKKTRPGILLTVLVKEHLFNQATRVILKETTSSGIRYYKAKRKILDRFIKRVKTRYGVVRVKVNTAPGADRIKTVSPEYEDCRDLAEKTGVPFKAIFDEAKNRLK
jgi:pyridinium-3,5-bisthiocarboxylic acid mononucleotide nickel chelatase